MLALLIALLLVLVGEVRDARSQAWVQPPGGYYASFTGKYFKTTDGFNHLGERQPLFAEDAARSDAAYREFAVRSYVEYGVLRWLTLVGNMEFKNARTTEQIRLIATYPAQTAIRTNYGMGDLWLSARVPIVRGRFVASAQGGVKIPLGYEREPWNSGPPLGTAEIDGELGVHAGRGFGAAYVSVGGRYRFRGGDLHDEWRVDGEVGLTTNRWFVKGRIESVRNVETPPDIAGFSVTTPISGDVLNLVVVGDQHLTKVGGEVAFRIFAEWSVMGSVDHVLTGKGALAGTDFILGLVTKH